MNLYKTVTTLLFVLSITGTYAQLKIDAELRPRFEYRHGYKTLFPDNTDPSAFVSQRTRLNTGFKTEGLDIYLSFQNIRVWGDVPQLNTSDANGIAIHQAWANVQLNENVAVKVGRQEILYDDSRILGNVGWAQQARSHDAALFKYAKEGFKFDLGFAFNQDAESLTGNILTTNTYKALQYLWMHKDWEQFSGSLLVLNNGLQYIDGTVIDNSETRYNQTIGTHLKYNLGNLGLMGNLYYQFGNDVANNDLSAYLIGLEAQYKASAKTTLSAGLEIQSGNDNGAPANGENKAFTPFYGTNHKFNGFMDYFYVGNHINNAGLQDIYAKVAIKLGEKSNLGLALHNFATAADYSEKQLGNEIDLAYAHKIQKYVTIKAGYSQLFESEGMEILKGNTDGNMNNWGWVMLVVKPTLFQSNK